MCLATEVLVVGQIVLIYRKTNSLLFLKSSFCLIFIFEINQKGKDGFFNEFSFNLNCSRGGIIKPSELLPVFHPYWAAGSY